MKISLNWLEEWVDLSGIDVDDLGHRLTMAGLEVEAVEHLGEGTDDIVVGRIESIEAHPNADRLVLCQVDAGEEELRQIACGATNMGEGDRVPVALPGSSPPAVDFEITSRELMGEKSEGMLCSAEELGLEESSEGLMILPSQLEVGRPVFEALELKDVVFEIDLTPNRSDCLSHLGVAREVAAIYERDLKSPPHAGQPAPWSESEGAQGAALEAASLRVEDPEGCPRYAFAILEDVEVGPSPFWLKRRLRSVGLRSVNNIVDATNFLLMDVGQPLHAFDLDELAGPEIVVRRARDGESIKGIDHNTYELGEEDLVIADAEGPVAIAGVMGGAATEVDESTERVLLECAYFDPRTVRRTAKRLGLHTDSSHRFERRVDPAGIDRYLDRAVRALMKSQAHLGDGAEARVRRGLGEESVEGVADGWTVELPRELPGRVLGTDVDEAVVESTLASLELGLEEHDESWAVDVPSYRGDLERPVDLVEEVARMHGYDVIPETLPTVRMGQRPEPRKDADHEPTIVSRTTRGLKRRTRRRLLDAGLHEARNHSFMSGEILDTLRIPEEDPRRELSEVANPLRADQRYMRTTLLPSLLRNLKDNRAQRIKDVALFEVGRRYLSDREPATIGLLLAGRAEQHFSESRDWDFFDLKGLIEAVAEPFELEGTTWEEPEETLPWLHPGVQAVWTHNGATLAEVGRLHPEIAGELQLEGPVLVAEIEFGALLEAGPALHTFEGMSRYPSVERDLALVVDESISYSRVTAEIEQFREVNETFDALLERLELFDIYTGEQVPEGTRSMAFNLVYRADDRTLTEDEVSGLDARLVTHLDETLGIQQR